MDQKTEDLYFPEDCFGPTPKACRPGVVYDKDQMPCLHGLVNGDVQQQEQCPLTYTQRKAPTSAETRQVNKYIVDTDSVTYHYRCPGKTPQTADLKAGAYVIIVDPHCEFDSGYWILHGLPTTQYNYSKPLYQPKPIPIKFFDYPNLNQTLKELKLSNPLQELKVPNFQALISPAETDIVSEIDTIQENIGKHPFSWWMWCIIAALIVAGLVALLIGIAKLRQSFKKPVPVVKFTSKNEQIDIESDLDQPSHTDTVPKEPEN